MLRITIVQFPPLGRIIGAAKSNYRRGLNIAVVNTSSGKASGVRSFDMGEGDHSETLLKFLQEIPNGSLVLMATYDEGSSKLKHEAKEEIKKLSNNLIDQISFRSSWVLLGTKGVPEHLKREMMVHLTQKTDAYNGWSHEAEVEGCIQRYGKSCPVQK